MGNNYNIGQDGHSNTLISTFTRTNMG